MTEVFIYGDPTAFAEGDIIHFTSEQMQTLNIAASRIVGRKSSGAVVGLTGAEVQAIIGDDERIIAYMGL